MATPMIEQYNALKKQYNDCILFFRLGDFYEMFGDDAQEASRILNITLTARYKGTDHEIPMCGVPHHAAEGYIAQLTQAGKKVALCEQVTQPNRAGLVEREVVRVITPGTTFDTTVLTPKRHNFLVGIAEQKGVYGLCSIDITTGTCQVTELDTRTALFDELAALQPVEIVVTQRITSDDLLMDELQVMSYTHQYLVSGFQRDDEFLTTTLGVTSLDSFGLTSEYQSAIEATALVLRYIAETQKNALAHIHTVKLYLASGHMLLDRATIRNLELLVNNYTFEERGSLLGAIDYTVTGMGGRLLREHIVRPLTNESQITARLDAVTSLVQQPEDVGTIREFLGTIRDIERLAGRIGARRATPRDLVALRESLRVVPHVCKILTRHEAIINLIGQFSDTASLLSVLDKSLAEDPPTHLHQGNVIREGFSPELDELRELLRNSKSYIAQLQAREIQRTGISSLKIKFNKIFGYYIEVSKANVSFIPSDYERKQTLVNAERFSIPELKEYEARVLTAQDDILRIELALFERLIDQVIEQLTSLLQLGSQLALLDVVCSHAYVAMTFRYTRPHISQKIGIFIRNGRHPVIEQSLVATQYIPNDTRLNTDDHRIILLTGPNMAGKSSYLRQTALIVLLAHIGSFVPADEAHIGVVDRIFTRVGASDHLAQGQSTFMVEMQEAAHIVHNATERSLIIIDELGRGTSTYDGLAIAWALLEYVHTKNQAQTLFATHYHELIGVADQLKGVQNYSVAVQETEQGVVFLHRVVHGAINQSYGIHVAQLAGLPNSIITRAHELLATLERNQHKDHDHLQAVLPLPQSHKLHPIIKELKEINLDTLKPLEALMQLAEWQQQLNEDL